MGQGALAIETRESGDAREACAALDHAATHAAVAAERAFLRALGGGCQVPVGAFAHLTEDGLRLSGIVIAPDGSKLISGDAVGSVQQAEEIGADLGADLLAQGARSLLEQA